MSRSFLWTWYVVLLAAVGLMPLGSQAARAEPVSFRNDVMAVLSKAGCNQGTCHGNQNGKNGFKVSLRGEDPAFDWASLTHDMLGRRTSRQGPAESLLLLKATAAIPHEGGRRFNRLSPEYHILAGWIAGGLMPDSGATVLLRFITVTPHKQVLVEPADRIQLHVQATFSDGTNRDVTRLAVYEATNQIVTITPSGEVRRAPRARPGIAETTVLVRYLDQRATVALAFVQDRPAWSNGEPIATNYIDRHELAKLHMLRIRPSEPCPDSVFLRRAHLDALGVLPTAAEARAFLNDPRADKRALLIDHLLQRPEFADFWALKWSDLLRNEEKVLDPKGVQVFHHWLRQCIADGKPLNEMARALIVARGSTYGQPPANYYRALRDPATRAEVTAQVFLGIRLQCCKCHNHPFDRWTQDDYYSLAAFFARVRYRIVDNQRPDKLDSHEFNGEQVVWLDRQGEVKHPRTGAVMHPRFLGATTADFAPDADRLQVLANWIAEPDNPFFARAQANRIWFHLLGRGLVDPNDDFRPSNPAANGPLLEALSQDLAAHHFDLRHLVRTIMNSRTYQGSANPNDSNRDDEANFSHALLRPLQAEQLLDALAEVTGSGVTFTGYPQGMRAGQLPGVASFHHQDQLPSQGEQFLKAFGKPDRLLACECERSEETTLVQAFQLITGELLNRMLAEPNNRLGRMLAQGRSNREIIDEFYLAALSRFPAQPERQAALAMMAGASNRRAALEDLVWGLVNAKEFLLRH